MNNFIEIIIIIIGILLLVLALHFIITRKNLHETEYEKKLKESLKDNHIIDPETGVKLTLKEAGSGIWLSHDNEFWTMPDEELDKIPTHERKQVEIALNYIRKNTSFRKVKLNEHEEKEY